jgi:hypothetical protein
VKIYSFILCTRGVGRALRKANAGHCAGKHDFFNVVRNNLIRLIRDGAIADIKCTIDSFPRHKTTTKLSHKK